jgi:biotin carboxyl carrier protein
MNGEQPVGPEGLELGAGVPAAGIVVEIQAAVLSHEGLAESATSLATQLAKAMRCTRVTVGWLEGGGARIIALSHGADFDARQVVFDKLGAAMDEAIEQGATLIVPSADASASFVTLAHEQVRGFFGGSVCTVPLFDAGRPLGAITLERSEGVFDPTAAGLCEDVACLVGPLLELKRKSTRSLRAYLVESARGWAARLLQPGHTPAKLAAVGLAALAGGAAFIPIPYHVGAPARLEASVQRVIVAPIDGFLEQVNVRPGDVVRSGQILAELAQQDLQVERAKRQSELAQHENVYRAALARADRSQFVINQAKAAEAEAQLTLLDNQIQRARIRAPFDGIVIKGDLVQSLGSPLQRGEVLLTLAPDERFRLIIEVDERDIALIQAGLRGKLSLAATPGELLDFVVARVLPVAAAGDGRNFFEVEATLDAAGRTLRPGLRGVAKVAVGARSAAWIASHRVVDWLRLTLWSLGA